MVPRKLAMSFHQQLPSPSDWKKRMESAGYIPLTSAPVSYVAGMYSGPSENKFFFVEALGSAEAVDAHI